MDINEVRTRTRRQYGYPDIKFSCNGTITKWIYGAKVLSSGTVQPELQIWRQTGLDTYTKIGFSSVTANATASPNVHEYYPNTTLQFQQGDVLGVYYPDEIHSNIEIYGQRGSGPHNYYKYLYYIDNAPSSLEISSLDISGNDFPLVSAVVSESSVTASQDSTSTMVSPDVYKYDIYLLIIVRQLHILVCLHDLHIPQVQLHSHALLVLQCSLHMLQSLCILPVPNSIQLRIQLALFHNLHR